MSVTDPIADMLTRIRNAIMARHDSVIIPSSKIKLAVARILKEEGFITDYEVVKSKNHRAIKIQLKYDENDKSVISGLERISKPGLRVYAGSNEIPRVFNGLGVAIVTTAKGVMTGRQAWRQKIGGEILCNVW